MTRKPIEFRQLCALIKTILQSEPTIDDAEWKARTLDTMGRWGFEEPDPATLDHAMTQVEQALKRTLGPRPVAVPTTPRNHTPTSIDTQNSRSRQPAGWAIVVGLMAKLRTSTVSAPSSAKPDGPRETLAITEPAALDEFWRAAWADGADRLALLRAFAEIAILRPAEWNPAEIRAHAHEHHLARDRCLVCRSDRFAEWHHVIQIQFGGSNHPRNRVQLCELCHAAVHPWLPAPDRTVKGFAHISACGDGAIAVMDNWKKDTA